MQRDFQRASVENEGLVSIKALYKECHVTIKRYRLAEFHLDYVEEQGKCFQSK